MTTAITNNTPAAPATPSTGKLSSLTGGAGGAMGKDAFLKLLVAQMKNQDPESPLKGDEMAAHLAQFSSLEQLVNINDALASQQASSTALIGSLNAGVALNGIGKQVLASGNLLALPAAAASGVTVGVGGSGGSATLRIFDAAGTEVGSRPLGYVNGGRQQVELGDAVKGLPPGGYSYQVDVTDAAGAAVQVDPFISGRVDGVQYTPNGPVFTVGPLVVPMSKVVEITA